MGVDICVSKLTKDRAIQFSEDIDCSRFWRWSIWILLKRWIINLVYIYSIPIGFSDLENVGLGTKFVFLGWPKTNIWAIQFSEDFDGGHFEKCHKGGGVPTFQALTSWLLISWVPWTKWYHSRRILGGGGEVLHGFSIMMLHCKTIINKYSENAKSCKALVIMYINEFILSTFSKYNIVYSLSQPSTSWHQKVYDIIIYIA